MDKKYLYPKEYNVKGNNELLLNNQKVINEYIKEKSELLINSDNKSTIISEIIKNIKELIEYDINNSTIISIPLDEEVKKILIQKHDMVYMLGNILLEYHLDLITNHKDDIQNIDYIKHVIDYNELYDEALTDYFKSLLNIDFDDKFGFKEKRVKNIDFSRPDNMMKAICGEKENTIKIIKEFNGIVRAMPFPIPDDIKPKYRKKSYLASFTFASLIERTIIDFFRDYYIDLGIKLLSKMDIETFNEDDIERRIMSQIRSNGTIIFFDDDAFLSIIIDMIKKYKVLNKDEIMIFDHKMTIGQILFISQDNVPSYFEKYFKKEYFYLLNRMFSFLNTRNNTMHLVNSNENYFFLEVSAILLQLYWLITNEEVFDLKKLEMDYETRGCD